MAKLISKTYGEALFELSVEENKTDLFMEEITALSNILNENPDFYNLMVHPKITKEDKVNVIEEVLKGRVSDEITGFFRLIIEKDRYQDIDAILQYFLDKMKEFKGIGVAYVETPIPLSKEQEKAVEEKLLATTGFKEMEMHYQLKKELIGGMVIRIGDRVVDSSVQNKLDDLKKQLLKIQLG